ncbi:MAG TPA: prephenate dehydratase [Cytophagales bacterium]|nr:prephenate dehydratase [Cytophagales bacterium]
MSKNLKIGIQGVRGSFHDMAAREYFNNGVELVECNSFRKLCDSLSKGTSDFAVMAIENSIAGSILPNYALLESYKFKIIGEIYQKIVMNLLTLPGQRIEDLTTVKSHPMALLQCTNFITQNPQIEIKEANDTAESAKEIQENKQYGVGAIAPKLAAELYGLQILEEGIEDNKRNFTRFLILSRQQNEPSHSSDKASVNFRLPDKPGSLADILQCIQANKINLTKIQSMPIIGKPYEYSFHVDMIWDDDKDFERLMIEMKELVSGLIIFGKYKQGEKIYAHSNGQ